MLLFGVFLNAAFLFPFSIPAIPLNSRNRNTAAVPDAYLFQTNFNSTNPTPKPDPAAFTAVCFDSREGLNLTAVAEDCVSVLNDIIFRLDEPFAQRAFYRTFYKNSFGQWIRARWVFGQCTIYVRSAQSAPVGMFSFSEVALTATQILSDCLTSVRRVQGGRMHIGSREQSFYVSVQGQFPDNNDNAINEIDVLGLPDTEFSKQTLDTKRGFHSLQPRDPIVEVAQILSVDALSPSNSSGTLNAKTDPDVDCFPRFSRLPDAHVDDCKFIINTIIVGMKDPFQARTWGYTDTADINLSRPQYQWKVEDCFIRVKNIDEDAVDTFSPVDVAEVALRIVQKCVVETKERLGGNADVGHLGFPRSFYVVVSGTAKTSGKSLGNNTLPFLSLGGTGTLESRASLVSPEESSSSTISTELLKVGNIYPVDCFDPFRKPRLKDAIATDCKFIADEIILRLPNPMTVQTFGYTDAADINLAERENGRWIYGQCVIYIGSFVDKVGQDRFRFLDVAYAAHRIIDRCIEGAKYAVGGVSDVGTVADKFYVGVAGMDPADLGNSTLLGLTTGPEFSSLSDWILVLPSRNRTVLIPSLDDVGAQSIHLNKRSSNATQFVEGSKEYTPPVNCLKHGMAGARKIEIEDCTSAAILLLSNPQVLVPQLFTTEPKGGIQMPFVNHIESCYLMMDTSLYLSVSASITLLKMVYWASEIMLTCISGREQGFGGVAKLDRDKGIFVSVTGVDPTTVRSELVNLSDVGTSAIDLEKSSSQLVESGQS